MTTTAEGLARILLEAMANNPAVADAAAESPEPYRAAAYAIGLAPLDGTPLWDATMVAINKANEGGRSMTTGYATPERIERLKAMGFHVEDMGKAWGADFSGQFRWLRNCSDEFQDWGTSGSEQDAWIECDFYAIGSEQITDPSEE